MLTVLTNIRSTKVLWLVEDNLRWETTFGGDATSKQGTDMRIVAGTAGTAGMPAEPTMPKGRNHI